MSVFTLRPVVATNLVLPDRESLGGANIGIEKIKYEPSTRASMDIIITPKFSKWNFIAVCVWLWLLIVFIFPPAI